MDLFKFYAEVLRREREKAYKLRPDCKAKAAAYAKSPAGKASQRAYRQTPAYKVARREYARRQRLAKKVLADRA